MDFITKLLAGFFETFKYKNPKLAGFIILFLGSIVFWAENGLGTYIGVDMAEIVKWVSIVLGMLTGSHTTAILNKDAEKKK